MTAAAKIVVARRRTADLPPASLSKPRLSRKRRSSLLPLRMAVIRVARAAVAAGGVVPAATTSAEVVVAVVMATVVVPEIPRPIPERAALLPIRTPTRVVVAAKAVGAEVETAVATEVARAAEPMEPRETVATSNSLAVLAVVVVVATVVVAAPTLPLLVVRSEPDLEQRVSWIERHESAAGEVRIILLSEHTD